MTWLGSVLLAASSPVVTDLLSTILRAHCKSIDVVRTLDDAESRLRGPNELSLTIVDADLEGGRGMELLERILSRDGARPSAILITSRPNREDETRASLLGAIGYLTKPVRFRDLARAVSASVEEFVPTAPRVRARPVGEAVAVDFDQQTEQVAWDIADLSATGALLSTNAPMEVGSELHLILRLHELLVPVTARVVRVQEPTWATLPGVAVEFEGLCEGRQAAIERHVTLLGARGSEDRS